MFAPLTSDVVRHVECEDFVGVLQGQEEEIVHVHIPDAKL